MNDLRNGILDIEGFLLGPDTKVEELERYFGVKAHDNGVRVHFTLDGRAFTNNGIAFLIDASFDEGCLVKIELRPIFPEIKARYDLSAYSDDWLRYYQELRVILDVWLEKQLGEPKLKNEQVTEYKFGNVLIATSAYIDTHDRDFHVEGGSLEIFFWRRS